MSKAPESPFDDGSPSDANPREREQASRRRGSILQLAATSYVSLAFGLITGPITARTLGPAGNGEVAAAAVYAGIAVLVISFGLPVAVSYYLATGQSTAARLLATIIRYAVCLVPAAILGGLLAGRALDRFSRSGRLGVIVMLALTPVALVGTSMEAMIRARGELGILARTRALAIMVPGCGVIVLWLTGNLGVLSVNALSVATLCILLVYTYVKLGARPQRPEPMRPLLGYGGRSIGGLAAVAVSARLDQAIVAPLLGAAALGRYALAATVSSLPTVVAIAIATRSFGEAGAADAEDRLQIAASYIRMTLAIVLPASIALAAVTPIAIPLLYGVRFRGAIAPTLILLPSTIAASFLAAGEAGLGALGRPGRASIAESAGTGCGLVLLLVLLPTLGINGAALATSVDYCVSAVVMAILIRRIGPCSLIPRSADVGMLFCVLRRVVRQLVHRTPRDSDG